MKAHLTVVLLVCALGLSACGRAAAPPSTSRPPEPATVSQPPLQPAESAAVEQTQLPEDLHQLRQKVTFPILVPTNVPEGLRGALWDKPELLPMTYIRYVSQDGKEELLIANGPSGSGLDADSRKTGESVKIRGIVTAHYLANQPEFGGPILWWNQWGAYVAISGSNLNQEDLVRIANSMSPTASLTGPAASPTEGEGASHPEQYVLSLFKGEATPDADARRILATLPRFNWVVYNQLSGGRIMELLDWLDNRRIGDVTDVRCVLEGTTGLDGAYSERYTSIVGTLFSSDPTEFVKALATLPEDQANLIISFAGYYARYEQPDIPPARQQLQSLLRSSGLTAQEAERANRLMDALSTHS